MASTHSPLRYPGGKSSLSGFMRCVFAMNDLCDGEYAEPYCGGAGVALNLLINEFVSKIHLNDVDPAIHAFWWSVLNNTDALCRRIVNVKLSIATWRRQHSIMERPSEHSAEELGFAAFFMNRVNRSGILAAGPIGGFAQLGEWGMDARFNRRVLCRLIETVATFKDRISLTKLDAIDFISRKASKMGRRSLIYFDPPYVVKGKRLYKNSYTSEDHTRIADAVRGLTQPNWIVSYDDVPLINDLYSGFRSSTYQINYSANYRSAGGEVMFFSPRLLVPPVSSPVSVSQDAWRRRGGSISAAGFGL
jgi:DNA adenine methylase